MPVQANPRGANATAAAAASKVAKILCFIVLYGFTRYPQSRKIHTYDFLSLNPGEDFDKPSNEADYPFDKTWMAEVE